MRRLLWRQLLIIVSTLFGVASLVYLIPALSERTPPASWSGYVLFLANSVRGDFGVSSSSGLGVLEEFVRVLPATLELSLVSVLLAVLIGVPAGVLAAQRRHRWPDRLIGALSLIGYSVPVFWWGFLLVLWFALDLGLTPASGRLDFLFDIETRTGFMLVDTLLADDVEALPAFVDTLRHLLLPALVLSLLPMAVITRVTRSAMSDALGSDYVRMARGQGIPEWRLVWLHGLRNSLLQLLSVLGLQLSMLMTGVLLTESIFSWPGAGRWLLDAFARDDQAAVQGGVLLLAAMVVLINGGMDLLYRSLNPRLRRPS